MPGVAKAQRTGRFLHHDEGTLYEVICPHCDMPQFHTAGVHRCISCNSRYAIVPMEIVSRTNPPVNLPGSKESHEQRKPREPEGKEDEEEDPDAPA